MNKRTHEFGGDWTGVKLQVIQKYLVKYTTALKKQNFTLEYIDAFAGTGYRQARDAREGATDDEFFPKELAEDEPQRLLDGSARLALNVDPPFSCYTFIEKRKERCEALERLRGEFWHLRHMIDVVQGDANESIRAICRGRDWKYRRLFCSSIRTECRSNGRR